MVLYKNTYKGGRWLRVFHFTPKFIQGEENLWSPPRAILWNSTTDLNRALKKQGLTNSI